MSDFVDEARCRTVADLDAMFEAVAPGVTDDWLHRRDVADIIDELIGNVRAEYECWTRSKVVS